MGEQIPGYRLRPVGSSGAGRQRLIGTREHDGIRVSVVIAAPGSETVAGEQRPRYLQARLPGVVPVSAFLDTSGGVAVIAVEPPRHTLAELLDRGPLSAPEIGYAVLAVTSALAELARAGLGHPPVRTEHLFVDPGGEVLLGGFGVTGVPLTEREAVAAGLELAAELLADVGPSTASVARLGLDAGDSQRRELAQVVAELGSARSAGADLGPAQVRDRLTRVCPPQPLRLPEQWQREQGDLAGRLRARAVEDILDLGSPRGSGLRIHWPSLPRAAGIRPAARAARSADGGARHTTRRGSADRSGRGWRARSGARVAWCRAGLGRGWRWIGAAPVRYLLVIAAAMLAGVLIALSVGGGPSESAKAGATGIPGRQVSSSPAAAESAGPREVEPVPAPRASNESVPGQDHTSATHDPVTDLSGPLTAPKALVQALSDLRARAWNELDPGALERVTAPGSPARTADTQAFERALADHLRYGGLEFTVRSARSVPTSSRSTPGTGHEEVTVDAVLDTGAFTIIGPDGSTSAVASAPAQGVRLVLSWSGARWQVARIHQQSG